MISFLKIELKRPISSTYLPIALLKNLIVLLDLHRDKRHIILVFSKQRKVCRVASIESEGEITSICSDPESQSCVNETQNDEDPNLFDDEAEIADLMNKIEHMKKERSILWLREFRDWMNISS